MDTPHTPIPPLLQWSAHVMPVHERSRRWYVLAGTATAIAVILGFFTGNWSFSLVALLLAFLYFRLRDFIPEQKEIRISPEGFELGGEYTSWDDAEGFWIVKTPRWNELHILKKKRGLRREAVIQTADIEIPLIRQTVSQFLPERSDQGERLLDTIIRICKL